MRMSQLSVQFDHQPSNDELADVVLGYGLGGTSEHFFGTENHRFLVRPSLIPTKGFAIWIYFFLFLMAVTGWCLYPEAFWQVLVVLCIAYAFILPSVLCFFVYVNKRVGTDPYISVDSHSSEIELPRLATTLPLDKARSIVVGNFGNLHHQVALLVQMDSESWTLFHLYNASSGGIGGNDDFLFSGSITRSLHN